MTMKLELLNINHRLHTSCVFALPCGILQIHFPINIICNISFTENILQNIKDLNQWQQLSARLNRHEGFFSGLLTILLLIKFVCA